MASLNPFQTLIATKYRLSKSRTLPILSEVTINLFSGSIEMRKIRRFESSKSIREVTGISTGWEVEEEDEDEDEDEDELLELLVTLRKIEEIELEIIPATFALTYPVSLLKF